MKVVGLLSKQGSNLPLTPSLGRRGEGAGVPFDRSAFIDFSFFHSGNPHSFLRKSTTINPALWRVPAYSLPGLPRPTISFIQDGTHEVFYAIKIKTAGIRLNGGSSLNKINVDVFLFSFLFSTGSCSGSIFFRKH